MKRLSLSYERRLHQRWEFVRFFSQSQVIRLSECVIFRIPNTLGHFRLGITLKARGTSLGRNQTKRAVREEMRRHALVLGSFDYNVVIPQTKRLEFPFPRKLRVCLERELPHALQSSTPTKVRNDHR